jgi:predicted transposase/invertase (TIGR01784 family)
VSFKKLCSKKEIVISLLNSFLKLDFKIVDISFISTEDQPELIGLKSIRFDIICTDETNSTFIVEMQRVKEPSFVERTLYYWSKIFSSELKISQGYSSLKPVMVLAFLNFDIFPKEKGYIHNCFLTRQANHQIVSKYLQITYVEFSKFDNEDPKTLEEQWMYLFKFYHAKGEIENAIEIVQTAFEVLKSFSNEDMDEYYLEIQSRKDIEGQIQIAKEEARKEGVEKGRKEGEEKVREEMVKKMLSKNKNIEEIIEFTGLSKEKIEGFQKNIK